MKAKCQECGAEFDDAFGEIFSRAAEKCADCVDKARIKSDTPNKSE